jgi:hypothetical protein
MQRRARRSAQPLDRMKGRHTIIAALGLVAAGIGACAGREGVSLGVSNASGVTIENVTINGLESKYAVGKLDHSGSFLRLGQACTSVVQLSFDSGGRHFESQHPFCIDGEKAEFINLSVGEAFKVTRYVNGEPSPDAV